MTPFPAAKPSALTTTGKLEFFKKILTCFFLLHILNFAVGILFLSQSFFIKAFDPSSLEAYLLGPKTFTLFFIKKSTIPFTNGSSGPTTKWGSKKSKQVDKWSAGCQVIAANDDWHEFMDICRVARDKWSNSFTYTLLDSKDLDL